MKRDFAYILGLLSEVESSAGPVEVKEPIAIYNAKLLQSAGLLTAEFAGSKGVSVTGLTWAGHDYLDKLRASDWAQKRA